MSSDEQMQLLKRTTEPQAIGLSVPVGPTATDRSSLTLGMPHLCLNGISENWILRHCGLIHWEQLAEAIETRPELMCDRHGNRLYASFIKISLEGSLTRFSEGDHVSFHSVLERVSALRYKSEHSVSNHSNRCDLRLSMCTSFVKRLAKSDNVHLASSEPGNPRECAASPVTCLDARLCREFEGRTETSEPFADVLYDPSPLADFNAAGLFYFAQYQAALDKAEWQLHRTASLLRCGTTSRRICYFGNLNLDDRLRIQFSQVQFSAKGLSHTARVYRESDGMLIAEATTRKES